jgi:hypothetical protein
MVDAFAGKSRPAAIDVQFAEVVLGAIASFPLANDVGAEDFRPVQFGESFSKSDPTPSDITLSAATATGVNFDFAGPALEFGTANGDFLQTGAPLQLSSFAGFEQTIALNAQLDVHSTASPSGSTETLLSGHDNAARSVAPISHFDSAPDSDAVMHSFTGIVVSSLSAVPDITNAVIAPVSPTIIEAFGNSASTAPAEPNVISSALNFAAANAVSAVTGTPAHVDVFSIEGITTPSWGPGAYLSSEYASLLQEGKTDGANWVVLGTDAEIDFSTGAISDYINNGFDQTESLSDMGAAIAAAEAQGLSVMLKPQVGIYHADGSFGNLVHLNGDPTALPDPAAFFAGYEAYILQWAELAQQYNVPILSIGNEMAIATQPQYTGYWDDIIASIRQVYHGELTYAAFLGTPNASGIDNEVSQIGFWNAIDYVGMDVYPDLTSQSDPTVAELNADWISGGWTQFVDQLAAQYGKPVLFTETGVNSYAGADADGGSEALVGQPGIETDLTSQELWWQSFFDTWGVNTPSWLAGVFALQFDPPANATYYTQSLDVNGKPAELVLSAWYGGKDYLSFNQSSFTGSLANDSIYLYGSAVSVVSGQNVSLLGTFGTTISISLSGTIINGNVQTVHFYINGIDEGAQTLANTPGTYVDSSGVTWTLPQTFNFTLPGAVSISQLKIAIDSPVSVGGPENEQTYINSIGIDGVQLTSATYQPLAGNSQQQTLGNGSSSFYDGGSLSVDASPWNSVLAASEIGTGAQPIQVDGGGGVDIVHVLGSLSDYTITGIGTDTIVLTENAGLDQNAVLNNIAYIAFQNGGVLATDEPFNGQIDEIYQAVLQRLATGVEITSSLAFASGFGNLGLIAAIVASLEAQNNVYPIVQIIELATGNMPTAAQLSGWVPFVESAGLLQGQSQTDPLLDQMAEAFVASTMFGNTYNGGTAVDPNAPITASIVAALIQAATGVAATQSQIDAWVGTGLSIDQVFVGFALGDQYTAASQNMVQDYLTATAINGAELSTVDGISATGALTLGTLATPLTGNELTVQGGSGSLTVVADGTDDTINLGVVSIGTSITAAQTIHASGAGDTITFATQAADGTAVTWAGAPTVDGGTSSTGIGANSTVNFGNNTGGGTETVVVTGDLTGATTSGGTSTSGIAMTTLGNVHDAAGDQIVFNNATTEILAGTAAINVTSAGSSLAKAFDLAAADAAASQSGGTIGADTGVIDWFQLSGNTYIVEAINNTASAASHSALAATDEVVKITGLVTLSGETLAGHTLTL